MDWMGGLFFFSETFPSLIACYLRTLQSGMRRLGSEGNKKQDRKAPADAGGHSGVDEIIPYRDRGSPAVSRTHVSLPLFSLTLDLPLAI